MADGDVKDHQMQRGSSSTALALMPAQAEQEQNKRMRSEEGFAAFSSCIYEEPFWTGFAAFQFVQEQDQFHVIGDDKDMSDFVVDDQEVPTQPEYLRTSRWGQWGYSTWCANIDDAVTEALNSNSRGWKRVPGNTYEQTKEKWWIVFGLELGAMQIRDYLQRFKLTSNVERKKISAWRIMEDINVREIEEQGGRLTKTIVKGRGPQRRAMWCRVPVIPTVMAENGRCPQCQLYNPLYWEMCAECYSSHQIQSVQGAMDHNRRRGPNKMEQVDI